MPGVGILSALTMQVWPGAFGTPEERMVVDELAGFRIIAVTLCLAAKRPHHLRMAPNTAFADIEVASEHFEGCVRFHARNGRHVFSDEIHRDYLHQAADKNGQKRERREQQRL